MHTKYFKSIIFTLLIFVLLFGIGVSQSRAAFDTVEMTSSTSKPPVEVKANADTTKPSVSTDSSSKGNVVQKNSFKIENPLKVNTISDLVQEAIKIASYVAIILAVLALVYVGFLFVMARGNTDKMTEYKTWLQYILIGVAIIIGARLIVSVVINTLEATGVVDKQVIQSANSALQTK